MENFISLPNHPSSSPHHSFKHLHTLHTHTINNYYKIKDDFKKRYWKSITNLDFIGCNDRIPREIKRIKRLRTFDITGFGRKNLRERSQLIASAKPFKKFLQRATGELSASFIQKHLVKPAEITLGGREEYWRLELTRFESQKLVIRFERNYGFRNSSMLESMERYQISVSSLLSKARNLKILRVYLDEFSKELLFTLLQILKKLNLSLGSLDESFLRIGEFVGPDFEEIEIKEYEKLSGALKNFTDLEMNEVNWYMYTIPISLEYFQNLICLKLVTPEEYYYGRLWGLQSLERLKRLDLMVNFSPLSNPKEFFESFSLPQGLEYLSFDLTKQKWRSCEVSFEDDGENNFLGQCSKLDKLRVLHLAINDKYEQEEYPKFAENLKL